MATSTYMKKLEKKVNDQLKALRTIVTYQIDKLENYEVSHLEVLGPKEYKECLLEGGEDLVSEVAHDIVDQRVHELDALLTAIDMHTQI